MSKNCPHCGVEIADDALRCYSCKQWINEVQYQEDRPRDFLETLLFAWFLGCFGIHRFYTGHNAIGIAQLLTLGGCGIWALADIIMICFNKFKDVQGRHLRNYNPTTGITMFVLTLIPLGLILFFLFGLILAICLVGAY